MTVHAFSGKGLGTIEECREQTIERLKEWSGMIERDHQPIFLALEINRSKGKIDPTTTTRNVAQIVSKVASDRVGICWDMGHFYSNSLHIQEPDVISKAFLNKVIHTHIHGVSEQGTHAPLVAPAGLPLEEYLSLLDDYQGIYNLEFNFAKFPPEKGWGQWIEESITRLRACGHSKRN